MAFCGMICSSGDIGVVIAIGIGIVFFLVCLHAKTSFDTDTDADSDPGLYANGYHTSGFNARCFSSLGAFRIF